MRTTLRSPLARRIQQAVLALGVAVVAAGCVTFGGQPTITQVASSGDIGGTLRYFIPLCSDSDDDQVCSPHVSSSFDARLVAAILVPIGSVAPAVVTTTLSEPVFVYRQGVGAMHTDLQAFRTTALSADFNAEQAPPSGSTWVAYISESMDIGNVSLSGTAVVDVQLPLDANGNPPATSARQASITAVESAPFGVQVTGTDPAPGQTDTLAFNCWEDADADGTPEVSSCIEEVSPATPQSTPLRRLTLTGASSATVTEAGGAGTTDLNLRLDGTALPTPAVAITTAIVGTGLTASAPASVTSAVGANVTVPVTLQAAKGAQPGTLTVTATTSNGTVRTAVVPVNVLSDDDGTRPSTTIEGRRLAGGKLRLTGQATDQNRSAGLTSVKVQAFRGIRNGRCQAWNGARIVTEACTKSLARWITLPLTIAPATTTVDWTATTPIASSGLWILRARAADGDGLVSRVGTARVTQGAALPAR